MQFDTVDFKFNDAAGKRIAQEVFEKYIPDSFVAELSAPGSPRQYGVDLVFIHQGKVKAYIDPEVRTISWGDEFPFGTLSILARKKKYDDILPFPAPVLHMSISSDKNSFLLTDSVFLESQYLTKEMTSRGMDQRYEVPIDLTSYPITKHDVHTALPNFMGLYLDDYYV